MSRKIGRYAVDEEEEWQLQTEYGRMPRLRNLAVEGRKPAMRGMHAEAIVKAVLAMRGVNQRMKKQSHQDGHLKLHGRPLAYNGLSRAWLRNCSMATEADDWTKIPKHEEDRDERVTPLSQVRCPACSYAHETANNKMRAQKWASGTLPVKDADR